MTKNNEIFRTSDEQGSIVVYELKKFRILTFDSISEQSKVRMGDPFCLDHEYIQAMLLPLLHMKPKHVTLLGLGGGALASCLYYMFYDVKLVAIEWREAVINIAYDYFDLPKDDRLEVKNIEALSWMKKLPEKSTDLILSDLYHAAGMNSIQAEKPFFEYCQSALRDWGWLVLNYHVIPTANPSVMDDLCDCFPSVFMLSVNTENWIVIASKQEITLSSMMSTPANNHVPKSLASSLKLLQGRLLKVNKSGVKRKWRH